MPNSQLHKLEHIGALFVNCSSLRCLDDASKIAKVLFEGTSPFKAVALPFFPIREEEGARSWQLGVDRMMPTNMREPTREEWVATPVSTLDELMDRASRFRPSPEEASKLSLAERITININYSPHWWPSVVSATAMMLEFYEQDRFAVVTLGDTLIDPTRWGPKEPTGSVPGLPFRAGDIPGPLANHYALDLRDLAIRVFPRTGADFGFVGRFPEQLGRRNYYRRPMDVLRLSWVNMFGTEWVARWGKDALLKAPGHKTAVLDGGAVVHQATRDLVLNEDPDPPWYDVLAYFSKLTGLECRVDTIIRPDLFETL